MKIIRVEELAEEHWAVRRVADGRVLFVSANRAAALRLAEDLAASTGGRVEVPVKA